MKASHQNKPEDRITYDDSADIDSQLAHRCMQPTRPNRAMQTQIKIYPIQMSAIETQENKVILKEGT